MIIAILIIEMTSGSFGNFFVIFPSLLRIIYTYMGTVNKIEPADFFRNFS